MKKLMTSVAAAAVLSVGAFADAADNTGNYLASSTFYATGGFSTDYRLINPSPTKAIVAKVAVREGQCSQESRDFLVYLTPGDVFDFTIEAGTNGHAQLNAEADESVTVTFPESLTVGTGYADYGYIEVFTLVEYDAENIDNDGVAGEDWTQGKALKKSLLINAYKNNVGGNAVAGVANVSTDILTGTQTIKNATLGLSATTNLTAVEIAYNHGADGIIEGREAQNTEHSLELGSALVTAQLMDNLKKKEVVVSYQGSATAALDTALDVVFIGKHTVADVCPLNIAYTTGIYDREENMYTPVTGDYSGIAVAGTALTTEAGQVDIDALAAKAGYNKGWVRFTVTPNSTLTNSDGVANDTIGTAGLAGLPLVPSVLFATESGTSTILDVVKPAFDVDGAY